MDLPLDLTSLIKNFSKRGVNAEASATNIIEIKSYPAGKQSFIGVALVLPLSREKIGENIKLKQRISKFHSITRFKSIQIISLHDPSSYSRIVDPARFKSCLHLQCFDLEPFIRTHMHQDFRIYACPICEGSNKLDDLVIDEFFLEILNSDVNNVDLFQIFADGSYAPFQMLQNPTVSFKSSIFENLEMLFPIKFFQTRSSQRFFGASFSLSREHAKKIQEAKYTLFFHCVNEGEVLALDKPLRNQTQWLPHLEIFLNGVYIQSVRLFFNIALSQ